MRTTYLAAVLLGPIAAASDQTTAQLPPAALAQPVPLATFVAGHVSGTWTAAGSPYVAVEDLDIGALVVRAGVEVRALPGVELLVSGTLVTKGTAAAPVVFRALGPSARWDGLWFRDADGHSTLTHTRVERASVSGIRIHDSQVTLTDCVVRNNFTAGDGAGIEARLAELDLVLTGCTIEDNRAHGHGGGISATMGTGTLALDANVIARNRAKPPVSFNVESYGGGLHVEGAGEVLMTDTIVEANEAWGICDGCGTYTITRGGGVYLRDTPATLVRCVLRENRATAYGTSFIDGADALGAGLCVESPNKAVAVLLVNTVVAGNRAWADARVNSLYGAAVCFVGDGADALSVINGTIARNVAVKGDSIPTIGGAWAALPGVYVLNSGVPTVLRNTVVHENTICQSFVHPASAPEPGCSPLFFVAPISGGDQQVTYSNVEGGSAGTGNFAAPPQFAGSSSTYHDLSILPGSPCVDAGDPDPEYWDASFPPSLGTERNDAGHNGGPLAGGWLPQ